jgi:hypothetical protein
MPGSQDFAADPRNENVLIYLNGQMVPRQEAKVSVFDRSVIAMRVKADVMSPSRAVKSSTIVTGAARRRWCASEWIRLVRGRSARRCESSMR